MTNLKSANIGFNKFCGPAVLSILTGKSTDDCAKVISQINGQYNITGVLLGDLLKAAEKLGFYHQVQPPMGSLYRTLTTYIGNEGKYIVAVPNHFVCIEIKDKKIYFCDNHTKEPIPAASSARLGQEVLAFHKVWEKPDYVEEKKPEPPKLIEHELTVVLKVTAVTRQQAIELIKNGIAYSSRVNLIEVKE